MIDALEGDMREHYMLHYNFPPYSVGETGRMGSPGRREVGHGKLAWRATRPLLPTKEAFPYTIRVVSEVTESNGSSSMATVCGTSLALMDAGVPLPRSVAGIAMGLIKEGDRFAVLSDILGDEDHLGDMDFKVAGTEHGVTSLQMDIKIAGITPEIMEVALNAGARRPNHILGEMAKALGMPRPEMRETVPRVTTIHIPTDKIGAVIGGGGKTIREITERTGTKIDIQDDGTVKIASTDAMASQRAIDWIRGLTASPEVGAIYEGKVARDRRFRRLREHPGQHRRALPHFRDQQRARRQGFRCPQGRGHGQGQGPGDGRPRQDQAQHAGRRSGHRRAAGSGAAAAAPAARG